MASPASPTWSRPCTPPSPTCRRRSDGPHPPRPPASPAFVYRSVRGVTTAGRLRRRCLAVAARAPAGQARPGAPNAKPCSPPPMACSAITWKPAATRSPSDGIPPRRPGAAARRASHWRRAIPEASGKLLVLVHGLCMNDLQWKRDGHDHGAALARDLGYTPVYLHYNSGRHISTNGRDFAAPAGETVKAWPVPVERNRPALPQHGWTGRAQRLPRRLQRRTLAWSERHCRASSSSAPRTTARRWNAPAAGSICLIGISPYSAPFARLGKIRSAGIQDLRHGNVRDADWQDRDGDGHADAPHSPALAETGAAATRSPRPRRTHARTATISKLRGDGLVPIASALGRHPDRALRPAHPEEPALDRLRDQPPAIAGQHRGLSPHPQVAGATSGGAVSAGTARAAIPLRAAAAPASAGRCG